MSSLSPNTAMFNRRTYLDYAAGVTGNPSSPHSEGRTARAMLEEARSTLARLTEVQPDDVLFTGGATEANALAILGHVRACRAQGVQDPHVLYLPSAHASIVENVNLLAAEGVMIEPLPIKNQRVDIDAFAQMLREETVLVAMEAVCGETGVVWNTREVSRVLSDISCPTSDVGHDMSEHRRIMLHVDASQAPLTEKVTRAHFGADMIVFDGSKVGPLHGIGALIAHRTISIAPLYGGGGQERGLVPGTESPQLAHAFAGALLAAAANQVAFRARAERERAHLVELITRTIPSACINEGRAQAPNILNLSLPGLDTDYLVALLDEGGFAVSTKSACESAKGDTDGSRAVLALTGNAERARSTLRVSWGPHTSHSALARFVRALVREASFLSRGSSAGRIDNLS